MSASANWVCDDYLLFKVCDSFGPLGFYRNGLRCMVDENVGCNVVNDCDANATCVEDPLTVQYYCKCNAGMLTSTWRITRFI